MQMKITKKIIALILTLAIGFSVCAPAANAVNNPAPQNFSDYRQVLADNGYPALSSKTFVEITKAFDFIVRFFRNKGFTNRYFTFSLVLRFKF